MTSAIRRATIPVLSAGNRLFTPPKNPFHTDPLSIAREEGLSSYELDGRRAVRVYPHDLVRVDHGHGRRLLACMSPMVVRPTPDVTTVATYRRTSTRLTCPLSPFFASLASASSISSSLLPGVYFRYLQHQPSSTSVWLTLVPSVPRHSMSDLRSPRKALHHWTSRMSTQSSAPPALGPGVVKSLEPVFANGEPAMLVNVPTTGS